MTTQMDYAARLVRLRKNAAKHTRNNTVGLQTLTLDAKCVAFMLANTGSVRCRFTLEGTNPTAASGFPLPPGGFTTWFDVDCSGSAVVIEIIEESGTKDIELLEILDQPAAP